MVSPRSEEFGNLPLLPTRSGGKIGHAATINAIRKVASWAGVPTQRRVDIQILERFGEHTLRVTGAQFFAAVLEWQLFVIQLYGRWGSMAVARYVQEAPLASATRRSAQLSVEEVLAMLKEHDGSAERRKQLAEVKSQLAEHNGEVSFSALESQAAAESKKAASYSPEPSETGAEPTLVRNVDSGVIHEVLLYADVRRDPDAAHWAAALCGWKYGKTAHEFSEGQLADVEKSVGRPCKTCRKTADRITGSFQSSASEGSE